MLVPGFPPSVPNGERRARSSDFPAPAIGSRRPQNSREAHSPTSEKCAYRCRHTENKINEVAAAPGRRSDQPIDWRCCPNPVALAPIVAPFFGEFRHRAMLAAQLCELQRLPWGIDLTASGPTIGESNSGLRCARILYKVVSLLDRCSRSVGHLPRPREDLPGRASAVTARDAGPGSPGSNEYFC